MSTLKELVHLCQLDEAEYQGKQVQLNKPFRTPSGPKKFSVYVKNAKGNVIKVNFGDSTGLSIKRDQPDRRKAFRARHKCDTASDPTTPRYWSCKMWQTSKSVGQMLESAGATLTIESETDMKIHDVLTEATLDDLRQIEGKMVKQVADHLNKMIHVYATEQFAKHGHRTHATESDYLNDEFDAMRTDFVNKFMQKVTANIK